MKKIIYYIVFAIFFVVIIYLLRNRNIPNLTKSPYIVNQCEDVTMDVISLEGTFITVAIGYFAKNSGIYGDSYILEININGEWFSLPESKNAIFFDVGLSMEKGKTYYWSTDLNQLYKQLNPGLYRILKDITICGQTYYISADFTIDS